MKNYLYGLLFLLLIIISVLFYFKKDIETTTHRSNKIDHSISVNVPIGNLVWQEMESLIKQEDNKTQRLRTIAYSPTSVGGMRFNELGFKIINGAYKGRGINQKSDSQEKLKRNQNILITLILVIMVLIIIKK